MATMRNVKVRLERVTRTDLLCLVCGSFRTEWGVGAGSDGSDGEHEMQAGVHTRCIPALHVKGTRKSKAAVAGQSGDR